MVEQIKLRFTGGWGVFSPLVAWKTKSRWTHVDIYMDNGYLSSMPFRGVRVFDWNYIQPKIEQTIYVPVDSVFEFRQLALSQLKKKYDWSCWLYYLTGIYIPNPNGWACAGLCATMLGLGDKLCSPGDLYFKLTGER